MWNPFELLYFAVEVEDIGLDKDARASCVKSICSYRPKSFIIAQHTPKQNLILPLRLILFFSSWRFRSWLSQLFTLYKEWADCSLWINPYNSWFRASFQQLWFAYSIFFIDFLPFTHLPDNSQTFCRMKWTIVYHAMVQRAWFSLDLHHFPKNFHVFIIDFVLSF